MRIKPEQVGTQLRRGLASAYLVSGDEPLQTDECCDAIRAQARRDGYSERETLMVVSGFDWGRLVQATQALSLFAQRRILEVHLPTGKPGDAGSSVLINTLHHPAPDTLLLLICPKLDAATQKTKWFGAFEQAGVVIQTWPVSPGEMPGWIQQRLRARGMHASTEAIALLAERVEGNLLAAKQDIEKLYLLHGPISLDVDAITDAVADSARFDVYAFVDSALSGDAARTARILAGLRGESVDAILLLWAIAREARALASMAFACDNGMSIDAALLKFKVWDKRKPLLKLALRRHRLVLWHQVLRQAAQIDHVIKGLQVGNAWDELLQLSLSIAAAAYPVTHVKD